MKSCPAGVDKAIETGASGVFGRCAFEPDE